MHRLTLRFAAVTLATVIFAQGVGAQVTDRSTERASPRAVTMWWVIFNNPDSCTASPGSAVQCGGVDVFGAPFLESVANGSPDPSLLAPNVDAGLAVVFATGGVTSHFGDVRLVASIYKGDGSAMDLAPGTDPMGLRRGLDSDTAEVHLVVRDHGKANRRDLLPQITNFLDPYCSDPNLLYFAGKNICQDVQFAVFAPDAQGEAPLFEFANPSEPLRGAGAYLMRDGDVVRAVVNARVRSAD